MRKQRLAILFLLIAIFTGCKGSDRSTGQPIFTPTPTPTATAIPQPTITPTSLGNASGDGNGSRALNFDTAPGGELSSDQIPSDCIGPTTFPPKEFINTRGLTILDTSIKKYLVLGETAFQKPIYSIEEKSPDSILAEWGISPNSEWLSYLDFTNVHLFDAWVENPKIGEKISRHFEGITISSRNVYWANNHQIVIPLRNKGDYFQWIVWDPFAQSEERVSARLTKIGKSAYDEYVYFHVYNPNTGTILYVCEQCGDNEFQIYDLDRGEIVESIDFSGGPFDDTEWAPYFTPGMQYTAFHFGGNKIWIFDENGASLLKVTMPFVEYLSWTGRTFRWSNDGKYLAMFRENPGTPEYYLSILDVKHQTMKNLCAQIPPSTLQWSYDNRYIIAMSDRSADDTDGTLSIIDVNTGEGETMTITDDGYLVGWLKP